MTGAGVIAVAGEALVDVVPLPDGGTEARPGGSPANVAVGMARLGIPTRLLARISGDGYGGMIRQHLARNGVDLDHAVAASEPSSLAVVRVRAGGTPSYEFRVRGSADWQWSDAELAGALVGDVRAVHSGSLALTVPPGAAALRRLLARAWAGATVSYDPNCRPALMGDPAAVLAGVHEVLAVADVVKVSAEDLGWLLPGAVPGEVLADWLARGPALAVVTLGADGALAAGRAAGVLHRPAPRVEVVDAVGAGDAFTAALLAGLHRRGLLGAARRPALRAIDAPTLGELVATACAAAGITCTRRGADPPTAAELAAARPA